MARKGKDMKLVIVKKGGSGSGDFGHSGRPGEVGGSSGGKGGPKNVRQNATNVRQDATNVRQNADDGKAAMNAKVLAAISTYTATNLKSTSAAKHIMYRLRKNSIVIQDIGGYFGHMTTGFSNDDLNRSQHKGLTVQDIASWLDDHGASKIPRAKRNRGAGIDYSIYD